MEVEKKVVVTLKAIVKDVAEAAKMMSLPESAVEEAIAIRVQKVAESMAEEFSEGSEDLGAFIVSVSGEVVCPN